MRFISSSSLLSLVALLTFSVTAETQSDVVQLTEGSYEKFLAQNNVTLVEFFAPWCGHCQRLEPEYKKAAEALKKHNVFLANVNCVDNEKLCSDQEIRGYPTLKIFNNGQQAEYEGPRDADGIVKYMKRQIMPAVNQLKVNEVSDFASKEDVTIVGVFPPNSKDAEAFKKVANSLRNEHVFASVEPGIYMVKKFDEGFVTFAEKEVIEDSLKKWISMESMPVMDELTPSNFKKYVSSGLPMAYLFYEKEPMRKEYGAIVEDAIRKYKGKLNAVYIDGEKYAEHGKSLHLSNNWPGFVIHDLDGDLKYPFTGKFNKEELSTFVEKFVNNKLEPTYHSAEIPEKEEDSVKTVVNKNFEKIVMDESKDVLLELYAPWCGHCKKLVPVYKALAESYAKSDKVVIAKMDATENDIPKSAHVKITKFPTLILFKAGAKKEQVSYEGDRSQVSSFIDFIAENGTHKVKVEAIEPPKTNEASKGSAEKDEL